MLIDITLILVVTKVYTPPFNRAAACRACQGGGVLVNIAFIWLLLVKYRCLSSVLATSPPKFPHDLEKIRTVKLLPRPCRRFRCVVLAYLWGRIHVHCAVRFRACISISHIWRTLFYLQVSCARELDGRNKLALRMVQHIRSSGRPCLDRIWLCATALSSYINEHKFFVCANQSPNGRYNGCYYTSSRDLEQYEYQSSGENNLRLCNIPHWSPYKLLHHTPCYI